jgi:hypothetical protein
MTDPIQTNTDVPFNMAYIRQCRCPSSRFNDIVSGFDDPVSDFTVPGTGCMVFCMLCSMMADFQAPLDGNAGNVVTNHLCQDQVTFEGPHIWCTP